MAGRWVLFAAVFAVLVCGFSSVSANPSKMVVGALAKAGSALMSWIWSIGSVSDDVVSTRSMIKFEGGYVVETVFDGSKLGIEPYSVEVSSSGELLILDAENSNVYKISMPFSQFCRPKLLTGSSEGYSGHVDGKLRDARLSHPRGLTVDQRGNIYIADTKNKAIRKISGAGVTTIAGGKWRKNGHVDGPSEESKFSNDFDVVYVGSSCSLLVVDRGNQAIREIQLRADDCTDEYDGSFLLGTTLLTAAMLLGYMLARFQFRVLSMFSSKNDPRPGSRKITSIPPYRKPEESHRHPLISSEEEADEPGENIIYSLGKLFLNTGSFAAEIVVAMLLGARRKSPHPHIEQQYQVNKHTPPWLDVQESFAVPQDHEPQHTMVRKPSSYSAAAQHENVHHYRRKWGDDDEREEQPYPWSSKMWYNNSSERNEVVFGEVQEEEKMYEQRGKKCCVGGGCVEGTSFSNQHNKDENSFVTEKRRMRD